METILIVDDEKNYLVVLNALLAAEGYEILTTNNALDGLRLVKEGDLDLIITDMKMPGMNGMALLEECKKVKPDLPIIIMTAYGTIEKAVEAMKKNAYDYISKPFQNDQLKLTVKKALKNYTLIKENKLLSEALLYRFRFGNIIGKSKPMLKIYELITKLSQTKASILISGPSGTGKNLIAKAIHYNGPRKKRPFISVNCGALTETLLESELFGHEKGAFTGAVALKKGRFELADEGTLFLDEVGEMSPQLQVKMLRVLQDKEFERVGGTKSIKVDVRILSASNRNIKAEVANGLFREDLFYHLNVIQLEVPALKDRIEDLPLLIDHFIEKIGGKSRKKIILSQEVKKVLFNYSWPGNIRELENVIEHALGLSSKNIITLEDLPGHLLDNGIINKTLPEALEQLEEKLIRKALDYSNNVKSQAADMLGISRHLMHYKMKKYGILIS